MAKTVIQIEKMQDMVNKAYNEVTFKNALLQCLDAIHWHHCEYLHKDTDIHVNKTTGVRVYKKKDGTWPANSVKKELEDWSDHYHCDADLVAEGVEEEPTLYKMRPVMQY